MKFECSFPAHPRERVDVVPADDPKHAAEQAAADAFHDWAWECSSTVFPLEVKVRGEGGFVAFYDVELHTTPLFVAKTKMAGLV
jgi:hypothetical protein